MSQLFIQQDPAIERKKRLAEAMMVRGRDTSPIRHWTQGVARIADSMLGAWNLNKLDKKEQARRDAYNATLEKALGASSQNSNPSKPVPLPNPGNTFREGEWDWMGDTYGADVNVAPKMGGASREDLISILAGNQDTLPLAAQFKFNQLLRQPKDTRTTVQKNAEALGLSPGSQDYSDYIRQVTTQPKSTVNVNTGDPYTPMQEELAKLNARDFQSWRNDASAAGRMVPYLDQMEQIAAEFGTGRTEQALAMLGQWLGTDSGAALQTWKAAQVPIMLQLAEAVKGPMTEQEWVMLREMLPNFGSDPRANKIVMELLRKGVKGSKDNFAQAQQYLTDNGGSLMGFTPLYARKNKKEKPAVPVKPNPQELDSVMEQYGI